eukprot:1617432-Lingulodinium_polyedra.AAC.1
MWLFRRHGVAEVCRSIVRRAQTFRSSPRRASARWARPSSATLTTKDQRSCFGRICIDELLQREKREEHRV